MKTRNSIVSLIVFAMLGPWVASQPNIVSYEYFFNSDPGQGNGTVIDLPSGDQSAAVNLSVVVPQETMAALSPGSHTLVVRSRDENGNWSIAFAKRIDVGLETVAQPVPNLVAAEYFFNVDPGQGNGTAIAVDSPSPSLDLAVEIPAATIDELEVGLHKLVVRTQDENGGWSVAFAKQINRVDPPPAEALDPDIARIEYEWYVDGIQVGDTVTLTPEAPAEVISFIEPADLSDLPAGGATAVLKATPFDSLGNQGWPAFSTVIIEWQDDDGDGLPNQWEELYTGFDPQVFNDVALDTDSDGLTDQQEFENETDPTKKDTDGDNVTDGAEITLAEYGFDPTVDDTEILAKFEAAASGTGIFANLVQDTIDSVVADPSSYGLFNETEVETAAQAARTFVNVSARVGVGGEDVVIPGFTIIGSTKKILIRAVGPKLADFGVSNPLADPSFEIYQARFDGQPPDLLASVDDWTVDGGDLEAIKAASESTGAFPLEPADEFQGQARPTDDTKSPATILELGIGVYTVVVRSVDGSFGEVLVEAYEIEDEE